MNKATRKLRQAIRAAGKKGEASVSHRKPVFNYHNWTNDDYRKNPSALFVTQEFPTATKDKRGVISQNNGRNMCQRVYVNTDDKGRAQSLTVHEPLNNKAPVRAKNHGYMRGGYRQPSAIAA